MLLKPLAPCGVHLKAAMCILLTCAGCCLLSVGDVCWFPFLEKGMHDSAHAKVRPPLLALSHQPCLLELCKLKSPFCLACLTSALLPTVLPGALAMPLALRHLRRTPPASQPQLWLWGTPSTQAAAAMATPSCLLRRQQWVSRKFLSDATPSLSGVYLAGRVGPQQDKCFSRATCWHTLSCAGDSAVRCP